jgi:hypothetical protein
MSAESEIDRRRADVLRLVQHASVGWAQAMRAHVLAPPDSGFAGRLRTLSEAAATEQMAWQRAHQAGMMWRPVPGAEASEPPYELRAGTGRRGPEELWVRFDESVAVLNRAITSSNAVAVADAFGAVSDTAADLADSVRRLDDVARQAQTRARATGTG